MPPKNRLERGAENFFPEMKTLNRMLSIKSNIVVCTSFFQYSTPGTQNMPPKNRLERRADNFFPEMKTLNRMLSIKPNIVVGTLFFWTVPP